MNKEKFFELLNRAINTEQRINFNIMEESPMRFVGVTGFVEKIDERLNGFDSYLTLFDELNSWCHVNSCVYRIWPFTSSQGPDGICCLIIHKTQEDERDLILIQLFNNSLYKKYCK